MSDSHVLVPGKLERDQVQRLFQGLKAAFGSGVNLGSRIPHIEAATRVIADLGTELPVETIRISARLGEFGVEDPAAVEIMERLAHACQALHRNASKLGKPSGEAGAAAKCGLRSQALGGCSCQPSAQELRPGA